MKKNLFISLGLVGLLGLASCASEDVPSTSDNGVTFTIQLPRTIQTRGAFGDSKDEGASGVDNVKLNNLQWTVFEVSTNDNGEDVLTKVFSDGRVAFASSQTEEKVTLNLGRGKKYQVAFYADDSTNTFVSYEDGEIEVTYSDGVSNTAGEDAFIGNSQPFTVSGAYGETITLTRPFAQLNWGSDDLGEQAVAQLVKTASAKVSVSAGLYTRMTVIGKKVSSPVAENTIYSFGDVALNNLPSQTMPLPNTIENYQNYKLIAMNYLLTGDGVIDCELSFNESEEADVLSPVEVTGAPVQINHRTNIYGSLLTAPAAFNIIVNYGFIAPANNVEIKNVPVWNGTETPVTPVGNLWNATTPEELAYILKHITQSDYYKAGTTIEVNSDMDFSGNDWTPIRLRANLDTGYTLTFDFKGHTLSGLNAAFFDQFEGTIKNVTFKNCTISTTTNVNEYVGVIACNFYGTLSNVHVENCTINCDKVDRSAGGICGQYSSGNASDCSVSNITINKAQGYKAGGMFGSVNNDGMKVRTFTNCTATGVNITDYTGNYGGGLIGRVYGCQLTLTGCSATDCTPSALYGGTAGTGVEVIEN